VPASSAQPSSAFTCNHGAGFNQSPRLVNLAGFFQRASIVTGFGWLTALSAQALAQAPAASGGRPSPESAVPAFHRAPNAAEPDVHPKRGDA
jgi:hypothetical protein